MTLPNWMRLSRAPDEVVGQHKMLRWHLIPPSRFFAIYLHKHQGDDPRTLHDHPADSISIRLRGRVLEYRPGQPRYPEFLDYTESPDPGVKRVSVGSFSSKGRQRVYYMKNGDAIEGARYLPRICFRRAEEPHRLEVGPGTCWTIWIRLRYRRAWGFFYPTGWRERIKRARLADVG